VRNLRGMVQVCLLFFTLVFLLGAGDDAARFNTLGHRLMCMCGCNQVLLECNHVGCQYSDRMRGELVEALQRGDNDSLALQSFVQKYGTTVLLAPSTTGFGRIAWIMPYLALFLGVGAVVLIVRGWNKRPLAALAAAGGGHDALDGLDAYRDQVRKDTEQI
jgi:cytochrome c-type biogenesis protein CcmH/NrfF